ncbi:hypothetical protein FISHEDRAFT_70992 [Fistulina hepatica ATCC 64428]|uniref:Uncharacterized protein n=1 Tax=Fistulina hepatica ATCC 64428 TaxID=1128425 RepID=A0A0D7AHL5_9AGAR|nr:hypothetical protein FISHEDRAFT_70992 [Fistulina hepatica ATCC 64428]
MFSFVHRAGLRISGMVQQSVSACRVGQRTGGLQASSIMGEHSVMDGTRPLATVWLCNNVLDALTHPTFDQGVGTVEDRDRCVVDVLHPVKTLERCRRRICERPRHDGYSPPKMVCVDNPPSAEGLSDVEHMDGWPSIGLRFHAGADEAALLAHLENTSRTR